MSDIVSARRLRKSLLKEIGENSLNFENNLGMEINRIKSNNNRNYFESAKVLEKSEKKNNENLKLKNKIIIKYFISLLIIFICLVCKLCLQEKILSNKYCNIIIEEYKEDYNKEEVLEKIEKLSTENYKILKYIVPENIIKKIQEKYFSYIKPFILNFYLKNQIKEVLNKVSMYETQKVINNNVNIYTEVSKFGDIEETLDGKGGGEPIIATASLVEESSAISMMQNDIEIIKNKNINIVSPLSGVITSTYGAREQIFAGVNSYHTGIDIAAKTGTVIKSATNGKVIKIKQNDKYYGHYVVIQTNGVDFKYAHLSSIKVSLNDEVTQNTIVGLVGSTGMSTGPHLHFEISINSRTVDPENLIDF